jgi:DNA-binding NarL/FixJ family response regulator
MFSYDDTLKMVLADGSAIVRAGIKRMLANVPEIQVVEDCTSAQAAIAAILETSPDLVMLDFHLGDGTAVDVLRACRLMRPRPICIVHTLETDASTRAISYASGADVFYEKGRDMAPLLTMLRKLAAALLKSQSEAVR